MYPKTKMAFVIFILLSFSSCVIFNSRPAPVVDQSTNNKRMNLEIASARFPLLTNMNWQSSSLHITVVNDKKKTVADVDLVGDSVLNSPGFYTNNALVVLHTDVRNFDKTMVLSSELLCPINIIDSLNFQKGPDDYYKITSSQGNQDGSCLWKANIIMADNSGLVYTYSGELINEYGTKVSFYAQGDPPATKLCAAGIIIASNISENMDYVVDLCDTIRAKNDARKIAKCKNPKFYLRYYPEPFAKLFYHSIYEHFYRDCKAEIICQEEDKKNFK